MVQSEARHGVVADGVAELPRGTNQAGMRAFNEKLILSLIRRHGALAKTDLSRLTGLSAQTISVIVRSLEGEELISRGEPQRGRIGQPSVPLSINPAGAYFLGLKIGRRSTELVLIDFLGAPLKHLQVTYDYPTPPTVVSFATAGMRKIRRELPAAVYARVAGLGVAMPFELWNWADMIGADRARMDAWRQTDIRAELSQDLPFPVYVENDATSACGAELVFGGHTGLRDFIYFYIGSFIGGGIVLNGSLYRGRTGNAGALGSMLVADARGQMRQLIDLASVHTLEERLKAEGRDPRPLWESPNEWGDIGPAGEAWIGTAGLALARAIVSATAVIDFEMAIVDGWMPVSFRARLVESIRHAMAGLDAEGIVLPDIQEGRIGAGARVVGAASLPLSDRFMIDQNAFS